MSLEDAKPNSQDVRYLYRLLLKRDPETEEVVNNWVSRSPSLEWLVKQFLGCDEFLYKYEDVIQKKEITNQVGTLQNLIDKLASKHPNRELYQPIYGLDIPHNGPIQRECEERCKLILDAFRGHSISNMSLLDVGSNMGFISFYLSEYFSKVVGLEYEKDLYDFSVQLEKIVKKGVKFKRFDFFQNFKELAGTFDVCLLFSVVHYLVAAKGFAEAKVLLAEIIRSFDFVIIELSSLKDYPYMPEEPIQMLPELPDYDYLLLGASEKNNRPIYLAKKKLLP